MNVLILTTPYEGPDFPEADCYVEFVVRKMVKVFGPALASVEVRCGAHRTKVWVNGVLDSQIAREIGEHVRITWWEEFCAEGYKAFAVTPMAVA
jgi:hypothetical protein